MSRRVMSCCVVLFLALTSVSAAHKKLKSITDLKKINFGQSVPKHSLVLLHWFANEVNIDNNNVIWLTFDPNRDYGSHHYGNYEELLDPLPRGNIRYRYYTVGNLYQDVSVRLPSYVVNPPTEYVGGNRDRIIIRVQDQNTGQAALQRIDQVYITQHYDTSEDLGTRYDPDHTYQITTNLLRQIREFSVRNNQMPMLYLRNRFQSHADDTSIRNTWGNLACLGLFLFIVIEEKYSSNQPNNRPGNSRPGHNRPVNNRPGNNRPGNNKPGNNRPGNNRQGNNNNRREINSRPETYNIPEIYYRSEINNGPENNTRSKNRYLECITSQPPTPGYYSASERNQ
ncbi:uncharacterized protein [Chaetodon trifascialis]|uniref:uncharacterized protein n=1 Tax=Chaetodon trifascialis TaxID=109706 RepID=UPI00399558FA